VRHPRLDRHREFSRYFTVIIMIQLHHSERASGVVRKLKIRGLSEYSYQTHGEGMSKGGDQCRRCTDDLVTGGVASRHSAY